MLEHFKEISSGCAWETNLEELHHFHGLGFGTKSKQALLFQYGISEYLVILQLTLYGIWDICHKPGSL